MHPTQPEDVLRQTTLANVIEFSGVGLFTGKPSSFRILPGLPNTGIVFQRVDLPGKPSIPARLEFVSETPRCTCLSKGGASIRMVEHLLSALHGLGVENAWIEVQGEELPASDGSAIEFVHLLERAGFVSQEAPRHVLEIDQPIVWSEGATHLIALPSDVFQISYTLHYPQALAIGSQYGSLVITPESYRTQIAKCRTFALYEELAPLISKGLLKGAGFEQGLVIQGDRVLNPEGVRCQNEMVFHKMLDLIGDMALIGASVKGHVIAICSGHAANIAFSKKLSHEMAEV